MRWLGLRCRGSSDPKAAPIAGIWGHSVRLSLLRTPINGETMNNTVPRLVFLHVPRTGGTTLHHHLSAHFAPDEICPERFSRLENYSSEQLEKWRFFSGHFTADEIRRIPGPLFIVTILRNPIERLLSNYYFWKRHRAETIEKHHLDGPRLIKNGTLVDFLRSNNGGVLDSTNNMMARKLAGQVYAWPDGTWRARVGDKGFEVTDMEIVQRALGNLLSFHVVDDMSALKGIYERVAQVFNMKSLNTIARLNSRDTINDKVEEIPEERITPEIQELLDERTRLDSIVYRLALDHVRVMSRRAKDFSGLRA
jgi:hypothetical protein